MFTRWMRCSFCGARASDVKKLVAGPTRMLRRVYICDRCAVRTIQIMDENAGDNPPPGEGEFAGSTRRPE